MGESGNNPLYVFRRARVTDVEVERCADVSVGDNSETSNDDVFNVGIAKAPQ